MHSLIQDRGFVAEDFTASLQPVCYRHVLICYYTALHPGKPSRAVPMLSHPKKLFQHNFSPTRFLKPMIWTLPCSQKSAPCYPDFSPSASSRFAQCIARLFHCRKIKNSPFTYSFQPPQNTEMLKHAECSKKIANVSADFLNTLSRLIFSRTAIACYYAPPCKFH